MRFWAAIFFILSFVSALLAFGSDQIGPKVMFFAFMVVGAMCFCFRHKYDKV